MIPGYIEFNLAVILMVYYLKQQLKFDLLGKLSMSNKYEFRFYVNTLFNLFRKTITLRLKSIQIEFLNSRN